MKILKYLLCGVLGGIVMVLPLYLHWGRGWLLLSIAAGVALSVVLVLLWSKPGVKQPAKQSVPAGLVTDPAVWDDDSSASAYSTPAYPVVGLPAGAVAEKPAPVSRSRRYHDCQNAIADAYTMYDRALRRANQEYDDKIQPINAEYYAALRGCKRDSAEMSRARKKYDADKAEIQKTMDAAISAAGAVLDLEIKHQNELMDDE